MSDEIKYSPSALICEAASLFYLLGGMAAKHLVIVGGLVPPLLVPKATDAHIGSADIDLCLSLAITDGDTREYYRSIEETIEPYFEPERTSGFRWRKRDSAPGLPLILDFLAPAAEDDTLLATAHARSMKRPQPRTRVHAFARFPSRLSRKPGVVRWV